MFNFIFYIYYTLEYREFLMKLDVIINYLNTLPLCNYFKTILNKNFCIKTYADFNQWKMGFQPAANANAEATQIFHNDLWIILGVLMIAISYILLITFTHFRYTQAKKIKGKKAQIIELLWTLLPIAIVFILVAPSFAISLGADIPVLEMSPFAPEIDVKIVGHQWYWTYSLEFKQFAKLLGFSQDIIDQFAFLFIEPIEIESFMVPTTDLSFGEPRNLKVGTPIWFPEGFQINASVTSSDVIHSWSNEPLNVKVDSVPGRINTVQFDVPYTGTYYGQCSEICGTNHGFMPIEVKVVSIEKYLKWLEKIVDLRSKQNGLEGLKSYLSD